MSENVLTIEQRAKQLESRGCTIVETIHYRDGLEDNKTGANRLGFYLYDGAYRIVQMTPDNTVMDAITQGISAPGKPANVAMGTHPNNLRQVIWQFKRQYGVKNAFTIVPEDVTIDGGKHELGATTAPDGNNVTTKRSACYPIWRIEGAGMLIYRENNADPSESAGVLRFFRIFEMGTNKCWRREKNDNVGVAEAPADQPPANQLFELYSVGDYIDSVTAQTIKDQTVLATDARPVKKVYMSTNPYTVSDLLRNISVQAATNSRDQGWANNPEKGQWSWFELAIFESQPTEGKEVDPGDIKQLDGQPLTWTSHENRLSSQFQDIEGPRFTWDHPLWRNLEQGNCIVLLACAQFRAWKNETRSGKLITQRIDMTRLQTQTKVQQTN